MRRNGQFFDAGERAAVIEAIRRAAAHNRGIPPGERRFRQETGFVRYLWTGKYWTRWGLAVEEAGFGATRRCMGRDDEAILIRLAEAVRHYGHVPNSRELNHYSRTHPGFPWYSTIQHRFGGRDEIRERLRSWAEERGDMADVVAHCLRPRSLPNETRLPAVYLIRSGDYCKIGWTSELAKRLQDIQSGFPEPVELVHAVRCRDPWQLEADWHQRFAAKRVRSEWFRLTPDEIAEFKNQSET